jgi:hypothetical protein
MKHERPVWTIIYTNPHTIHPHIETHQTRGSRTEIEENLQFLAATLGTTIIAVNSRNGSQLNILGYTPAAKYSKCDEPTLPM